MTEFEKIYRTYFEDVYLYILRLSGDENTAEEITSQAFFKAMRAINGFRGECHIRVWLCQIAKNCYYTHLRKSKQADDMDAVELSELLSEESAIEDRCIQREEAARVRTVLHTTADPYKEVFMWRVFAELSFKQIGQIFGKSENWACVTYHRAKKMIQSKLEAKVYEK